MKQTTISHPLRDYAELLRQRFHPHRKLLLLQAPQFLFDAINVHVIRNRGYYAYPPTGLQWLATSLSDRDIRVNLHDLNLQILQRLIADPGFDYHTWLEMLDDVLDRIQPSIVAVSCLTVYADLFNKPHPLTDLLAHLMGKGRYLVIAGGPTASNEIEGYLQRNLCHFVIDGEGEYKINYLIDLLLADESSHPEVPGIFYHHAGRVQESGGDPAPVTVKGNLIESYRHVAVEEYCQAGCLNPYSRMMGQDTVYGVFQLNRGCRCDCAFCGVRTFMGKGVRSHQVESALAEVHYLVEERGVRHFEALDDDLLAAPAVTMQFLEGLIPLRQTHGITWAANNGLITNSLTKELLDVMQASGCIGFKIGIEAGSTQMLRRMKKPGTPATFEKIASLLQKYPELFVGGNYIIGLFGEETFAQMLQTYRLSIELNLDWSSFSLYQATSKATASDKATGDSGNAIDFIPTKSSANRELREDRSLPLGPKVFSIPGDTIPSQDLMKNIWLTFNMAGNYIGNKNLKPGGDAATFVSWVNALRISYPDNPYMALFAGLGQVVTGNIKHGLADHAQSTAILAQSESWQYRFEEFHLAELMLDFPKDREQVYKLLARISAEYAKND
jgi:hypothetical protein